MKNHIFMRFPEGKAKAFTLSYDDGVKQDIPFIELIKKYNLKSTFHINSRYLVGENIRYTKEEFLKIYDNEYCEVACHGMCHPFYNTLPTGSVVLDTITDRKILEETTGKIVKGMSYPYGSYSDDVIAALKACNINYCRTVRSTGSFDLPNEWLALHPTCHHSDQRVFDLIDSFVKSEVSRTPKMFYLWGHTYEFDRNIEFNSWKHIEKIMEDISGKDDIWYATNGEIFDYVRDFEQLEFSADLDIVHNPTNRDIWFTCTCSNPWGGENFSEEIIKIAPGETKKI